ncbi:hypothetical protein GJ496_006557 [Pomphorhynchus laevis]|nr:hypothetical protein GJ496_006557 [Pomphorhynchus laevis]
MATIDWNKLVDDDSDDEKNLNIVQEKKTSAEPTLPEDYDYTDPETSIRTVITYEWLPKDEDSPENDPLKAVKKTYKYKVEQKKILQCVARRKHLKKFGLAENDPPGPNPHTTSYKEEINIQYVKGNDAYQNGDDEPITKFTCSHCGRDHQSSTCPTLQSSVPNGDIGIGSSMSSSTAKYVAPSRRMNSTADVVAGKSASSGPIRGPDEPTIRVTNLPIETRESDLKDLFGIHGHISRIHVPRDMITKAAKGYAFITFDNMMSANKAAKLMNNYPYAYMALSVEVVQRSKRN